MLNDNLFDLILSYYNPYKIKYNYLVFVLKQKFNPPKCKTCRRFRPIRIFDGSPGWSGFCSKSCYRYYYGYSQF